MSAENHGASQSEAKGSVKRSAFVQKIRVPVTLSQPNEPPRDGWLLLYPQAGYEDRPESIVELLNSTRSVIPFVAPEDGSVLLLTRSNIDWVVVKSDVSARLILPPEYRVTHEQRVELRFEDESRVEGVVQWDAPTGNHRLSDFLNWTEDFFVVQSELGTLVVNRERVRETRIAEEPPRALDVHDAGGGTISLTPAPSRTPGDPRASVATHRHASPRTGGTRGVAS